jgi:hypothetical protein
MKKLLVLLLLLGCGTPQPSRSEIKPATGPTFYVEFDCKPDDHVLATEVDFNPDWPPTVCACSDRH